MRLALCLGLLVTACANPPRHVDEQIKPTTIKSPDGQVLCAVHKIPLTTLANTLFLTRYMGHFLVTLNALIKDTAETDQWMRYLPKT